MLLVFLAGAAALAIPASARPADEKPVLRSGTLPDDFTLDGILDEPAWAAADSIDNLTMIEPDEGAEPTVRTVVKVLSGPDAVVFGIRCAEPEPDGIVSFSVARDASLRHEDHVKIVLDTFGDGRTGYVFSVNPSGARYDALVISHGEYENDDWNGLWEAKTVCEDRGWTTEIRIPVSTLNFKKGLHTWNFNVQRRVQRLMETDRWASPHRDYEITQTRHAGLLTGLPDFDLGLGLSVRPALVTGIEKPSRNKESDFDSEISLDITQKLGPNLMALLTLNTDFAETEVDEFRTNLTRFPLFFPEKRTFFQEGSDVFDFGFGLWPDIMPFHSRRVGLVDGKEVPLRAGAKMYGQVGDSNIGLLVANMGREDGVAPQTNLGLLRFRQNIFDESSVGLIATQGDPLGRNDSWMLGGDFTYNTSEFMGDKNFLVGVWGLSMDRESLGGGSRSAFGTKIDYPNDIWDVMFTYKRIGKDFDPSLGFVPRTGINKYHVNADYAPYPEWDLVRRMYYELSAYLITDLEGDWESYRVFTAPVNWTLESGDSFEFNVINQGEKLPENFEISNGVWIPGGSHDWTRYRVQAGTAQKRRLSAEAAWWFGPFYDGELDTLWLGFDWNPLPLITIEFHGERNMGRMKRGHFTEEVYGSRLRFNFSPDLTLSSLIQYESGDSTIGTNTRLHWIATPESSLYFIFNYNWNEIDRHWKSVSNKSQIKIEYTFRF